MSEPQPPADAPELNGRFLCPSAVPLRALRRLELQSSAHEARPELILGESSLLPFHFLRTGERVGRSVVKIRRGDGACGTGFLVAPDVLLTNHHVLPDAQCARSAVAVARFEAEPFDGTSTRRTRPVEVALAPDLLFVTEPELDFTFCGVIGLESFGTVPLDRSELGPGPSDVVNIIQHPRGRPKEVALRDNQIVKSDGVVLHYVCDTEPGSSGSPVFDNAWRLVALHHASIVATELAGGRRAAGRSADSRFLNEGVRLSALARWMESEAASGSGPGVERVRGLFRGMDPRAGFFGAIGRSPGTRTAAEFLAASEADGHSGESLDVAFWDLRALASRPVEELGDIGAILASIGMDVWLLAHASEAQAQALAEHVEAISGREHRLVPGSDSLAVIARASRAIEARRVVAGGLDAVRVRIRLGVDAPAATIALAPLPRGGSPELAATLAALGEVGRSTDILLIGDGPATLDHAGRADLEALGLTVATASGPRGGVVLARRPGSPVTRVFASPGLGDDGEVIRAVTDRSLPETPPRGTGLTPIAARVILREK